MSDRISRKTYTPNLNNTLHNSSKTDKHDFSTMFDTLGEIRLGYWLIIAFVLIILGLMGTIPLSSAAIAPGVVSVEGSSKIIQHFEGGIVQKIFVHDGDYVSANQELVKLSDVREKANYQATQAQLIQAFARKARWVAESQNKNTFDFNQWLLQRQNNPQVGEAMQSQMEIYTSRLALFEEQRDSFLRRQVQAQKRLVGNTQRITALKHRLELVSQELSEYEDLDQRGLITRDKLFNLKIQKANIQAELADTQADIAESTALLNEAESQISQLNKSRKKESVENLDRLHDEIADLKQRFAAIENRLQRTTITSPISGFVVNLQAHTQGGVIAPGQTILEIVPNTERLLVKAKIDPKNRDTVKVGQRAEIRFSAFNQRVALPVEGKVKLISADRFVDPVGNTPYYKVSIELIGDQDKALNGEIIHPGMQAEVMILTGKRTVLQYIFSPITKSFNRALRED